MSTMDVFSRRYRHRIGSGLYPEHLWLHRYEEVKARSERLGEFEEYAYREHVNEELKLRQQVLNAVAHSQGSRGGGTMPDSPRVELADLYQQVGDPLAEIITRHPLDWLLTVSGKPPFEEPIKGSKWGEPARVLIFDYVETLYNTLGAGAKTEFSRDLSERLGAAGSPWSFVLGRWRRPDWPAERDTPFDAKVYALKRRAEEAMSRRARAALAKGESFEDAGPPPEGDSFGRPGRSRNTMQNALAEAAEHLANAERLLNSDPILSDMRYRKAVDLARKAFDRCATEFDGSIFGPFVEFKQSRAMRGGLFGLLPGRDDDDDDDDGDEASDTRAEYARLRRQERPHASAFRIHRMGQYILNEAAGDQRRELLLRAPMAEFLMRLVLFGPSKKEAGRYARATSGRPGGKLDLRMDDIAKARLAVDLLSELCLYAAGADDPDRETPPDDPAHSEFDFRRREAMKIQRNLWLGRVFGVALLSIALLTVSFFAGWTLSRSEVFSADASAVTRGEELAQRP